MASEREWLPQTAEKYSREDARREEQDSPTDPGAAAVIESLLYIKGKPPEKTDDLVIFSEVCCMFGGSCGRVLCWTNVEEFCETVCD